MIQQNRDLRYFRVISRVDGFELGQCLDHYYVRHPRGLIDWLDGSSEDELLSLLDDVPQDVVCRMRAVLAGQRKPAH